VIISLPCVASGVRCQRRLVLDVNHAPLANAAGAWLRGGERSPGVRAAGSVERVRAIGVSFCAGPRTSWGGGGRALGEDRRGGRGGLFPVRGVPASGSVVTVTAGGCRYSSTEPRSTRWSCNPNNTWVGQASAASRAGSVCVFR